MRRTLVSVFPSAEVLGLLFGATISAAINLLTALASNGITGQLHSKIVMSGWILFGASSAIGTMAVLVGQKRSDVLDGTGGTLSVLERKALVRQELEKTAPITSMLGLVWIAGIIYVMIVLTS